MSNRGTDISTEKDAPLVSVIINCLNSEKYLREAIDSVIAQTYPMWELIAWDNFSTDSTPLIISEYEDERVRYFRSTCTEPLGFARNGALSEARGKYIAFLDSDDRWHKDKLHVQVQYLERHENVGMIYGNCNLINEDGEYIGVYLRWMQPSGNIFRELLRSYTINLQTVILRTDRLALLGDLFDPCLEVAEEYDLFLRFAYYNSVDYLNVRFSDYRVHSNMSSITKMDMFGSEQERILEKLTNMVPDFATKYAGEICLMKAYSSFRKAKACMNNGQALQARKWLSPYRFVTLRYFIVYLLTKMPPSIWMFCQRANASLRLW